MAQRCLLVVFSHPDDELLIGPLLLKYARAGHQVHLLTITPGQKGIRPHAGIPAGPDLGRIREVELAASARHLGVTQLHSLGYEDQGIAPLDVFWELIGKVRDIVNQVRPDVILSWGPDGMTGHIDHRVSAELATIVFQERRLLAAAPQKLYFFTLPESVFGAVPNPLNRKRDFLLVSEEFVTTVVDCAEVFEESLQAIECHRTQWRPERMDQMKEFYRKYFRGQVHLRLALTMLGWPRERERCILEGLR